VSFVIGLILFTAGLYGKVGTKQEERLEEAFRHRRIPDPETHTWDFEGGSKPAEQTEESRFASTRAPGGPARAGSRVSAWHPDATVHSRRC
jgi:hypothetical protein